MKKLSLLLFAVITAVIFYSCTKEDSKNDSSQIVDPIEIKENVLVKKITRTEEQGYVQTFDFKYDGNKIISIESEEEKLSFFYSGNLIVMKEVYYKTYNRTETTNYSFNGKILKTVDNIAFTNFTGTNLMFKAPNITTTDGSEMYKYRGYVYINQDKISEYITIYENYDLLKDKLNPLLVYQNTYKYTYDENKNPFYNIIGMSYLLNNNSEFGKITPLLNAVCKNNVTEIKHYSWDTYWGNPTSITKQQTTYTYGRVYIYNEFNYPIEINETEYKESGSQPLKAIKKNIIYKFYY